MLSFAPLVVFIAVTFVIIGAYWIAVVLPEQREQSTLRKRLKADVRQAGRAAEDIRVLKQVESLSNIGLLDFVLKRLGGFSTPLKESIAQAGLPLTVGAFLLICTSTSLICALVVHSYTGLWWLALLAGAFGGMLPVWVVRFFKRRRIRQFEEQFPEAIELIARAMRAGHAFATGLKMAADELPAPAGPEFKLLYERQNYGAQLPDALRSFADRIPSLDARFFVTAVLTQREAGGNLSEVLDRLAAVMRERFRIKREVRVRSAHGRVTAYVLAGMPPVIAMLMMASNPDQLKILTTDPLGVRMIFAAVVLQVLGTLIVRKLVDIEY